MPHRIPLVLDQARDWMVVLWEPLMFWAFAAATAAGAATLTADGEQHIEWLSLAGYGMGAIIDLAARGRAYAAMPEDRRKSRWREWKERLLWGAIGLGVGVMISAGINGEWLAASPTWHPLVNTLCVGALALPLVDFTRALARFLSGQSDVFGGLVINFVRARSGAPPRDARPAPPRDEGES